MAVKIIEKENGEVVTKSSRQVRKEKLIAKAKKYIFVSLAVTILMSCSLVAFAAPAAPSGVDTATMGTLADIPLIKVIPTRFDAVPGCFLLHLFLLLNFCLYVRAHK